MRKRVIRTVGVAVALAGAVAFLAIDTAPGATRAAPNGEARDLATLIKTTAPFHDVDRALEAGWTVEPMCMDYPDGYVGEPPGTMGHHFYNEAYILDGGHVEASQPELLLYEKQANGRWRFNAVEYLIPARDLPPTAEPPRLFGREFRFFPEVGSAGIWGLHVWVWRHNPHGLYANVNPRVSCEHAEMDHSDMDHSGMQHNMG
jgi:hypothetical protein